MNDPIAEDGWLIVPFQEPSYKSKVEIGYSALVGREPEKWTSAYMDYHKGQRVARIFGPKATIGHSKTTYQVYLRVDGHVQKAGKVSV